MSINTINQESESFRKEAAELEKKRKNLTEQYQSLEQQLAGVQSLAENVKFLGTKVDRIEKSLGTSGAGFKRDIEGREIFGKASTIKAIQDLGKSWNSKHPERPLSIVGKISQKGGGEEFTGDVHKDGGSFHIRPLTNNGKNERTNVGRENYSADLNKELVQMIKQMYPAATIFFNDPALVRLGLTRPANEDHICVRLQ